MKTHETLTLTFDGTTAHCSLAVTTKSMLRSDSGKTCVLIEGECDVAKDVTYTVEASGTIVGKAIK